MMEMTREGRLLAQTDIAELDRLVVGHDVEIDALAQARILAQYHKTLMDGGIPRDLADTLTIQWSNFGREHRFWVRPIDPVVSKQ